MNSENEKPLTLLRAIDRVKKLNVEPFGRTPSNKNLLFIKYPNPDFDYFFVIHEVVENKNGYFDYKFTQKPASESDPKAVLSSIVEKDFSLQYNYWVKIAEEYEDLNLSQRAIEDQILEQYEQEEYDSFVIIDDDADKHSYSLPVQLYIDTYLSDVVKRLEAHLEDDSLDNPQTDQINEIIDEAKNLKAKQTQLTKQQVVKGLAKFWAKARKAGLDIFVEVRKEAFKEAVKSITKKMLEDPEALLNGIRGLLD